MLKFLLNLCNHSKPPYKIDKIHIKDIFITYYSTYSDIWRSIDYTSYTCNKCNKNLTWYRDSYYSNGYIFYGDIYRPSSWKILNEEKDIEIRKKYIPNYKRIEEELDSLDAYELMNFVQELTKGQWRLEIFFNNNTKSFRFKNIYSLEDPVCKIRELILHKRVVIRETIIKEIKEQVYHKLTLTDFKYVIEDLWYNDKEYNVKY